jgi:putative ubiquitin-RnfH superfamily antitoxin RatB of RatAB toxin-antitoxin module
MPNPEPKDRSGHSLDATNDAETLEVDVCYALPGVQTLITVNLPAASTVRDAIEASGILGKHPEIDISTLRVGIFGRLEGLETCVSRFDRVEIYRPLIVDPKIARQRRVEKIRAGGSIEGRKWTRKEVR